jgi:hypothetical protein
MPNFAGVCAKAPQDRPATPLDRPHAAKCRPQRLYMTVRRTRSLLKQLPTRIAPVIGICGVGYRNFATHELRTPGTVASAGEREECHTHAGKSQYPKAGQGRVPLSSSEGPHPHQHGAHITRWTL